MRRPWNVIDTVIYSLATYDGKTMNMNICSYVMPVSRIPKLYAIALEQDSRTYQYISKSEMSVLQLLKKNQMDLVRTLGKKSGFKYDKHRYLQKKDKLTLWQDQKVLKNCAAYLLLHKKEEIKTGDHRLFIFNTLKYKTESDTDLLMWSDLVNAKIIL